MSVRGYPLPRETISPTFRFLKVLGQEKLSGCYATTLTQTSVMNG